MRSNTLCLTGNIKNAGFIEGVAHLLDFLMTRMATPLVYQACPSLI